LILFILIFNLKTKLNEEQQINDVLRAGIIRGYSGFIHKKSSLTKIRSIQ
jgi:hypothetical protein